MLANTFLVAIHVKFLFFMQTTHSVQLKGCRYLTQESVIRWLAERADKLTFYLLGFSLHVELLNS